MFLVLNSTLGSTIAAGTAAPVQKYFHVTNDELLVLPVSIYLIGYILGPLAFAPLSESYGRKIVMISTFIVFTAFVLGCALAPSFPGLVVMRLLAGIGASTPVSVIGGIYADIYNTSRARGMAITVFMAGTTWGPLGGPVISGFVSMNLSWRWVFWVELIMAGVTWPLLLMMPETYAPVILRGKAKKLRKETGNQNIVAPAELEEQSLRDLILVVLTRPVRMFLFEAIVLCTCLYLSLAYGIFYSESTCDASRPNTLLTKREVSFQAYPIVFEGIYGFNPGEEGLTFMAVGVGSVIAAGIYIWWDYFLDRTKKKPNPPAWSQKEEFNRLPLACFGGPLFCISLFWLGWTARPDIPWIVPVLAGLPFGIGFLLIFMALINYVVDAYEIFAASAMGATSASRSIFGVVLPFAAKPMYTRLEVSWACTLLGILSVLMTLIPFVFIKYGGKIRANSKFCQELKQKKEEEGESERRRWAQERIDDDRPEDLEKQL